MAENVFDQFDDQQPDQVVEPTTARPSLWERFRLNMDSSRLSGTPEGALGLAMRQAVRDRQVENGLVIDPTIGRDVDRLAEYKQMPTWQTWGEGAAALAGQLAGGMMAPSSWLAPPERFAALGIREGAAGAAARLTANEAAQQAIGRTVEQGAFMSGFSTVMDPAVQGANILSGVEQHYDPAQTAIAPFAGFAMGTIAHGVTEGARSFRDAVVYHAMLDKLGTTDPNFAPRPGPAQEFPAG